LGEVSFYSAWVGWYLFKDKPAPAQDKLLSDRFKNCSEQLCQVFEQEKACLGRDKAGSDPDKQHLVVLTK